MIKLSHAGYGKQEIRIVIKNQLRFIEAVAADELPHQAGGGDLIVHIGLMDEVQDLDHGAHLFIAILLGLYCRKQGENVLFQHGQFIEGGAVEDHVGILSEGVDPSLFPAARGSVYPCRGLCSFYAEEGGMLVGFEKAGV